VSTTDRLPPHSVELEQACLATLLETPRQAVSEFLSFAPRAGSYFYDPRHQMIFEALAAMIDQGKRVTLESLSTWLRERKQLEEIGGVTYLGEILNHATSFENLKDFTNDLRGFYIRRCLIQASVGICEAGYDQDAETALGRSEQALIDIRNEANTREEQRIRELILASMERFENAQGSGGKAFHGLPTGFYDLDSRLRGLRPGQLITIAARPAQGKTSLMLNVVERVGIDDGIPAGVFSLEMTSEELAQRLICARARVPGEQFDSGNVSEVEHSRIAAACSRIAASPLHFCDEGGLTITQLRSKARRMVLRHHIKLLAVDYIQLLKGTRRETRTVEITEVSNGLKALAKELALPVIALSQLNRDVERDGSREPRLSDLRDSGSVEQDSDIVMFIHTTEDTERESYPVSLLVRKHRNGPTGKVPLMFFKKFTRFESAAPNAKGDNGH
jgi:replicative DNA helicase